MRTQGRVACGLCVLVAASTTIACRATTTRTDRTPRFASEVQAVALAQQDAWNRGDLAGFMQSGYAQTDALTFFSGGDVTRGYDTVLARYRKRYSADGAEMGRLAFTQLETQPLGSEHALLRGRWDLDFRSRPDVGGLFSLVLTRTSVGWRIVHDHTSVADAPPSE